MGTIPNAFIPVESAQRTKVLFLAKNAGSIYEGIEFDNHRNYHQRLLTVLKNLGFVVEATDDLRTTFKLGNFDYLYGIHSHFWFNGKEAISSAIAEYFGVPYLGPRPTVRAVMEDKVLSKHLARSLNIPTPRWMGISKFDKISGPPNFSPPWVLKPRNGIASQMVKFIRDENEWRTVLNDLQTLRFGKIDFIAEKFIDGINLSVPFIEGIEEFRLPVFEEFDENEENILSYKSKRGITPGYRSKIYQGKKIIHLREYADVLASACKPFDYGRFEFRYDIKNEEVYFLEGNLICNASEGAIIGKSFDVLNWTYDQGIGHIIATSLARQL